MVGLPHKPHSAVCLRTRTARISFGSRGTVPSGIFAFRCALLCSTEVSSPATVGFRRPVLLLPENFFTGDLTQDDLSSALSHEFAHVRRRDFVLNLLYEMVYLTVCFHPFAAFMRSRIAHTRELACDEMAVCMLPSGAHYASSLL